jgi:hypothetical protein
MTQKTNAISWINRLVNWIESLPGPTWLFYLSMLLLFGFLNNATLWLDETLPLGVFDFYRTSIVIWVVYPLGLFQYLISTAKTSLHTFAPLLGTENSDLSLWETKFTKFPSRIAWLVLITGILFRYFQLAEIAGAANTSTFFSLTLAYNSIFGVFAYSTSVILITQSVRQMILVGQIHREARGISLFQLDAAHAFSNLTSRIGIGAFLLTLFSAIQNPELSIISIVFNISGLLVAMGAFVLPLAGMRTRLQILRKKKLSAVNQLIEKSFSKLNMSAEVADQKDVSILLSKIKGFIIERNEITNISTLPWETATFRGFATTILLPMFLWFVTRLLERFL